MCSQPPGCPWLVGDLAVAHTDLEGIGINAELAPVNVSGIWKMWVSAAEAWGGGGGQGEGGDIVPTEGTPDRVLVSTVRFQGT